MVKLAEMHTSFFMHKGTKCDAVDSPHFTLLQRFVGVKKSLWPPGPSSSPACLGADIPHTRDVLYSSANHPPDWAWASRCALGG